MQGRVGGWQLGARSRIDRMRVSRAGTLWPHLVRCLHALHAEWRVRRRMRPSMLGCIRRLMLASSAVCTCAHAADGSLAEDDGGHGLAGVQAASTGGAAWTDQLELRLPAHGGQALRNESLRGAAWLGPRLWCEGRAGLCMSHVPLWRHPPRSCRNPGQQRSAAPRRSCPFHHGCSSLHLLGRT